MEKHSKVMSMEGSASL